MVTITPITAGKHTLFSSPSALGSFGLRISGAGDKCRISLRGVTTASRSGQAFSMQPRKDIAAGGTRVMHGVNTALTRLGKDLTLHSKLAATHPDVTKASGDWSIEPDGSAIRASHPRGARLDIGLTNGQLRETVFAQHSGAHRAAISFTRIPQQDHSTLLIAAAQVTINDTTHLALRRAFSTVANVHGVFLPLMEDGMAWGPFLANLVGIDWEITRPTSYGEDIEIADVRRSGDLVTAIIGGTWKHSSRSFLDHNDQRLTGIPTDGMPLPFEIAPFYRVILDLLQPSPKICAETHTKDPRQIP